MGISSAPASLRKTSTDALRACRSMSAITDLFTPDAVASACWVQPRCARALETRDATASRTDRSVKGRFLALAGATRQAGSTPSALPRRSSVERDKPRCSARSTLCKKPRLMPACSANALALQFTSARRRDTLFATKTAGTSSPWLMGEVRGT